MVLEPVIAEGPTSAGDARWDALVAGVVEQLALARGVRCPRWVFAPERYLASWWFVSPYASLHPSAFVESPAALANHGVFVPAADLTSL